MRYINSSETEFRELNKKKIEKKLKKTQTTFNAKSVTAFVPIINANKVAKAAAIGGRGLEKLITINRRFRERRPPVHLYKSPSMLVPSTSSTIITDFLDRI